jgi:WD40 repeat protein
MAVRSIALFPDGNRIVSGSDNASVWVWDAKTGEQLRELQGHIESTWSVGFSPDGQQIVENDDNSV